MDTVLLLLRVGLSLAAVLGLLWWISRRAQASMGTRRRRASMAVVGRQQLGRRTGVALLEVEGRRLVVGYGEQGVTLLHDAGEAPEQPAASAAIPDDASSLDSSELIGLDADSSSLVRTAAPVPAHAVAARTADASRLRTPLEGSILAPDTWRKAVVAVQERTTRRL